MAANHDPVFELTPKIGKVVISVANTNLDGSGTLGLLIAGGDNGTRISQITIQAVQSTTAGMVRFFIKEGASYYLFKEVQVQAITLNGVTLRAFNWVWELFGERAINLPATQALYVSTYAAETFHITCKAGDY